MAAAAHTQLSSPARRRGLTTHGPRSRWTHAAFRPPPRPEYVPNRIDDPDYVRICDSTLRVLEQSLGATKTAAEKLAIARQLALLGVDIIEVGFPASSPDNLCTARSIAEVVGKTPVGEHRHVPVICGVSRCIKEDIDAAWEAVRHSLRPRINMSIATSEMHIERKLKPDRVVAIATEMVTYARSLGCPDVQFSVDDAGRSNREFLYRILEEVIKAGATTVSILDSDGYTYPYEFGNLIADIKANTPGIENAILSAHCQNGHGLATTYALTGACAGARQLEVTINGFSERAGNASLEEVVMAIRFHGEILESLYTGINCKHVDMTSKMEELANTTIYNADENKNKGLLGFIYALTGIIFLFYSALVTFSLTYPGTPKAVVSFNDTSITAVCFTNFRSWITGSVVLVPFSAHFKSGKSTDHVGFDIFMCGLFLWLLLLIKECCYTLHIFLKIPMRHVLPVGIEVFCLMVFISVPYIECQRPTIVSKWAKHMWEKITLRLQNLPRWFRQAYSWFCAKLSCVLGISTTEDEETSPSCCSMELGSIESGPSVSR